VGREIQVDLVDPTAQARCECLGGCLARINRARSDVEDGLLLIEGPGQGDAGSKDADGTDRDECRRKGTPDLVANDADERSVLAPGGDGQRL
jgi:hypothetical protein